MHLLIMLELFFATAISTLKSVALLQESQSQRWITALYLTRGSLLYGKFKLFSSLNSYAIILVLKG